MSEWESIVPDYKGFIVPTAYCPDCGEQIIYSLQGSFCHCSKWEFSRVDGVKVIKRKKIGDQEL